MLNRIHPTIIIASSIAVLAIAYAGVLAGTFVTAAQSIRADQLAPNAQVSPTDSAPAVVTPAPTADPTAAPTAAAPTSIETVAAPSTAAPSAPAGYTGKYATEMSAAGIAESDQPIVASLMLNGDQWAAQGSPQMREISRIADPASRFVQANAYVQQRWGSWQGAANFAAAHGGNW